MDEYIEREAAIGTIMGEPTEAHYPSWYADKIKNLPSADVAPVVHGRWKLARYTEAPLYLCSECNKPEYKQHKFCPHCGAKMDLEEPNEAKESRQP